LSVSTASGNQFAYTAEPVRCFACSTQQKVIGTFTKDGGDADGIMVRMTQTPD